MGATKKLDYTILEYAENERSSDIKHEFHKGEIFAMSGGTFNHNTISGNITTALNNAFEAAGKDCNATSSDQRIYIEATDSGLYPDSSVFCGKVEFCEEDKLAAINPILLVEVMSKSTGDYDRGGKFSKYRQLASFREYILIAQNEPVVEVLTRQPDGSWKIVTTIGLDKSIYLHSIDCSISMKSIYRRTIDLKSPTFRLFKEE